jgi:hypothetical protein
MTPRMKEALQAPVVAHPYTSSLQFAAHTASRKIGGASMDLNNWQLSKKGSDDVFVGGERDTQGNAIDEKYVPLKRLDALKVMDLTTKLRNRTGGTPDTNLGSWVKNNVAIVDASKRYTDEDEAMAEAQKRNQEAIFSQKKGEILNSKYDPDKPKV